MTYSRRSFLKNSATAPLLAYGGAAGLASLASPAQAGAVCYSLGSITGNDPSGFIKFGNWLGRKPSLALLAFNQSNATELEKSIPYICQQAMGFRAAGARILWSVPFPGAKQLESVASGSFDALYTKIFKDIIAASPADNTPIYLRLPWEFNLSWQENAAVDKNGRLNATAFIQAWRQLSAMAIRISPRFFIIWCPNVNTNSLDPLLCWPGGQYVHCVTQDFYMQQKYNKPGDFAWFLKEQRGLLWGADLARTYNKKYGLSEWGMDSDIFVADFNMAALWMDGLGTLMHHQCWWDRGEVIDSRLTNGARPRLAAAYKAKFG
jgi:hypothetical protein